MATEQAEVPYPPTAGCENPPMQESVQLFNGQGTVQLDEVLEGVLKYPAKNISEATLSTPISHVLNRKDVFFDMQVDT